MGFVAMFILMFATICVFNIPEDDLECKDSSTKVIKCIGKGYRNIISEFKGEK